MQPYFKGREQGYNNPNSINSNNNNGNQVGDDERRCFFGPSFFRGIKYGALLSGCCTLFAARRIHTGLIRRAKATGNPDITPWTVDQWMMGLSIGLYCTVAVKFGKFVLARGRYNEFLFDEILSRQMEEEGGHDEEAEAIRTMLEMRKNALEVGPKRELLPTFWDGFAVGVLGTLQDSYNPTKPPWFYLNMKAGLVA
eukprot:PhM_4_TR18216/c0_g1_i1/m.16696